MKIALIKETVVDNVIVADEAFLERADKRWLAQFTEMHLLDDGARVAGGFALKTPLGAGVHDLREETADALGRLYIEPLPPEPVVDAAAPEAVVALEVDTEAETDPEIEIVDDEAVADESERAAEPESAALTSKRKSKKRKR